ncbi:MAG: hypothetical protein WBC91_15705 [Phototrophicaceae bacterium]
MKRMIVIWCVLISSIIIASLLHPAWSMATNPWTINALILLTMLLFIELGLVHYRSRMLDLEDLLKQSQSQMRSNEKEQQYISQVSQKE